MKYFLILLKGFAMGAADVVPGVSGGTIAFITGIYERLLGAIASFDKSFFLLLLKFEFKKCWQKIDGTFLLILFVGIFSSILSLAKIIIFLLETYPVYIRSFFFGLILVSARIVIKKVKKWKNFLLCIIGIGALIAYLLTSSSIINTPDNLFTLFLSGFVAIIAMILPGISGSYILLILGKYQYVIGIVANFADKLKLLLKTIISFNFVEVLSIISQMQLLSILMFALGAILGLLLFSKLLKWLLNRYYDIMIALLTGFMLGSLNKVWPWKETIETYIDRHGDIKPLKQEMIWPVLNGKFLLCVMIIIFAIVFVLGIEFFGKKNQNIGK